MEDEKFVSYEARTGNSKFIILCEWEAIEALVGFVLECTESKLFSV